MEVQPHDFASAFEKYFEGVYSYIAFRLTPDTAWAADITQDVFVAAMEGWDTRRADCSIKAWLRGIASRKVADFFRNRYRESGVKIAVAYHKQTSDTPQQRACLVAATLQGLPPQHAELLEWKYLDGHSVREIAERLNKSEKAVESALTRAREAFQEVFKKLNSSKEVASNEI